MFKVKNFPVIPVKVPKQRILKRLGYKTKTNIISQSMLSKVDNLILQAADLITLSAMVTRAEVKINHEKGDVFLPDRNIIFNSSKFTSFLESSTELLVIGITGGFEIADKIKQLQLDQNMTEAVIIDAAASEIVDEGFEWVSAFYRKELVREGKVLSNKRFSAGYGDLDITHQLDIFNLLELNKIGVEITKSFMLVPEKSVTAFYGIK